MNDGALGFFDSGVGGLTVVRAVQDLLPQENIVYLGDTARLPYGSKSPDTIRQFALEDTKFLISKGVKAIVVACNTATAHALPLLQKEFQIPIMGVIEPGVEAALSGTEVERIGIIATRGTIQSHVYQRELASRRTGLMIYGAATPLLVPLIEEDWISEEITEQVLLKYLNPLLERRVDTLMLACTHYPLLVPLLRKLIPNEIRLIDSAGTCAVHVKRMLAEKNLIADRIGEGELEIFLTDLSEAFEELATRFLLKGAGKIKRAVI